jgi:hypothetical protein
MWRCDICFELCIELIWGSGLAVIFLVSKEGIGCEGVDALAEGK